MSSFLLERLPPEVWRVYAAALAHRRSLGEWPSAEAIVALAKAEGASPGAALVLTRFELLAADGSVVPLDGYADLTPAAVVPDAATGWAILVTDRHVFATLRAPEGYVIRQTRLRDWIDAREIEAGTKEAAARR